MPCNRACSLRVSRRHRKRQHRSIRRKRDLPGSPARTPAVNPCLPRSGSSYDSALSFWRRTLQTAQAQQTTNEHAQVTPDQIMQIGLGFMASKTLLTAVELGLFTELANAPASARDLQKKLGLHQRSLPDFLDALVSLGLLERNAGIYANTAATELFLDRNKPTYVVGLLDMANARLWEPWGNLTTALKTGEPQNEV